MCRFYELGQDCKFGKDCSFAHGDNELKARVNIPSRYKTKPCKQFHEKLYCPYGKRCQF